MKSEKQESLKNRKFDKTIVGVFVIITIVIGIIILALITISNPFENRKYRIDGIIMSDFTNINYEIQNYYQTKKTLPNNLEFSGNTISEETKQRIKNWNYKYTKKDNKRYSICGEFQTDNINGKQMNDQYRYGYYENFNHKVGYDCIEFEVTEDNNYPVIKPVSVYD